MKKLLLLTTIMMALTGCPGDKNKGRTYYPGGYTNGNCINCGINEAPMSHAVTATIPQASLTLQLMGDQFGMGSAAQFSNPIFSYQGPFRARGELFVSSDLLFGNCRLPSGDYIVQTPQSQHPQQLNQGIYNRGVFQVPAVELIARRGHVRMLVALTEGVILTDGNGGAITSFGVMMYGLQGPSAWNINMSYNQPYGPHGHMGMQQVQCGDTVGVRF